MSLKAKAIADRIHKALSSKGQQDFLIDRWTALELQELLDLVANNSIAVKIYQLDPDGFVRI